ncbi:MAG: amino acid synthesis family protein [Deltaproteobacteria bacterium]|nr:amino acid synthesis family protein [Deltaproteobacteria bacterium]
MEIRKLVTMVEETHKEADKRIDPPTRKAAALAVIDNPLAGRYVEDLTELMDMGAELGALLGNKAREALGIGPERCESYGKAAIVGMNGELEHAGAILHPKLGKPFREALGRGLALIPSVKKRGGPGCTIDIPLNHKDAAFVRSHFDGMTVSIEDAPGPDEILVALAVTDSGRPLPRIGGLTKEEAKYEDGLR